MKKYVINCSTSDAEKLISEYVHKKRDREILRMKWCDEETYSTIAEHFQMSDRGVQYVCERYRKKFLKYFV